MTDHNEGTVTMPYGEWKRLTSLQTPKLHPLALASMTTDHVFIDYLAAENRALVKQCGALAKRCRELLAELSEEAMHCAGNRRAKAALQKALVACAARRLAAERRAARLQRKADRLPPVPCEPPLPSNDFLGCKHCFSLATGQCIYCPAMKMDIVPAPICTYEERSGKRCAYHRNELEWRLNNSKEEHPRPVMHCPLMPANVCKREEGTARCKHCGGDMPAEKLLQFCFTRPGRNYCVAGNFGNCIHCGNKMPEGTKP